VLQCFHILLLPQLCQRINSVQLILFRFLAASVDPLERPRRVLAGLILDKKCFFGDCSVKIETRCFEFCTTPQGAPHALLARIAQNPRQVFLLGDVLDLQHCFRQIFSRLAR